MTTKVWVTAWVVSVDTLADIDSIFYTEAQAQTRVAAFRDMHVRAWATEYEISGAPPDVVAPDVVAPSKLSPTMWKRAVRRYRTLAIARRRLVEKYSEELGELRSRLAGQDDWEAAARHWHDRTDELRKRVYDLEQDRLRVQAHRKRNDEARERKANKTRQRLLEMENKMCEARRGRRYADDALYNYKKWADPEIQRLKKIEADADGYIREAQTAATDKLRVMLARVTAERDALRARLQGGKGLTPDEKEKLQELRDEVENDVLGKRAT